MDFLDSTIEWIENKGGKLRKQDFDISQQKPIAVQSKQVFPVLNSDSMETDGCKQFFFWGSKQTK